MGLDSTNILLVCGAVLVLPFLYVVRCCFCSGWKRRNRGQKDKTGDVEAGTAIQSTHWNHHDTVIHVPLPASTNYRSYDGINTLDLHHYNLDEAMYLTQEFMEERRDVYFSNGRRRQDRYVEIITGRGLHSRNGVPVIRPKVEEFLEDNGYNYNFARRNSGLIQVDFGK